MRTRNLKDGRQGVHVGLAQAPHTWRGINLARGDRKASKRHKSSSFSRPIFKTWKPTKKVLRVIKESARNDMVMEKSEYGTNSKSVEP